MEIENSSKGGEGGGGGNLDDLERQRPGMKLGYLFAIFYSYISEKKTDSTPRKQYTQIYFNLNDQRARETRKNETRKEVCPVVKGMEG